MSRRTFFALALLVSLAIAGVGSYYASTHPDGLEHVAEQAGFLDSAEDPQVSGPLADYRTEGVEGDRLSGGLAGVAGVALVGVIGGGLFWVLRRRTPHDAGHAVGDPDADQSHPDGVDA